MIIFFLSVFLGMSCENSLELELPTSFIHRYSQELEWQDRQVYSEPQSLFEKILRDRFILDYSKSVQLEPSIKPIPKKSVLILLKKMKFVDIPAGSQHAWLGLGPPQNEEESLVKDVSRNVDIESFRISDTLLNQFQASLLVGYNIVPARTFDPARWTYLNISDVGEFKFENDPKGAPFDEQEPWTPGGRAGHIAMAPEQPAIGFDFETTDKLISNLNKMSSDPTNSNLMELIIENYEKGMQFQVPTTWQWMRAFQYNLMRSIILHKDIDRYAALGMSSIHHIPNVGSLQPIGQLYDALGLAEEMTLWEPTFQSSLDRWPLKELNAGETRLVAGGSLFELKSQCRDVYRGQAILKAPMIYIDCMSRTTVGIRLVAR